MLLMIGLTIAGRAMQREHRGGNGNNDPPDDPQHQRPEGEENPNDDDDNGNDGIFAGMVDLVEQCHGPLNPDPPPETPTPNIDWSWR